MSHVPSVFQQFLSLVPRHLFEAAVETFQGNRYTKTFKCWSQFLANLYAQVASKESLRDVEIGLKTQTKKWFHLGLVSIARSTLAEANEKRDYRIYETLFYKLFGRYQGITPKHNFRFKNKLFSLDATLIFLCLSLYPWAKYRKRKGAVKLHCLLDHRGEIPAFVVVTDGKNHEGKVAQNLSLPLPPDSILVVDRAYVDFEWLENLGFQDIFFVIRMKDNIGYRVTGQQKTLYGKGILADQTIELTGLQTHEKYPQPLRLVTFYDEANDILYRFLTNNFALAASTIAKLYKERWKIELFFKWIKQHLKIKSFLGTSENAVMTQIWTAMIAYLLLAFIKFQTKYSYSLLGFSRMIQAALFDRVAILELLSLEPENLSKLNRGVMQLTFL